MSFSTITISADGFVDHEGNAVTGTATFKSNDEWDVNDGKIALPNEIEVDIAAGAMPDVVLLENVGGYHVTVTVGAQTKQFDIPGTISQNLNAVDTGLTQGDVAATTPNWKDVNTGDLTAGVYTIGATDWTQGLNVLVAATIRVPAGLPYKSVPIRKAGTGDVTVDGPAVTLDLPNGYTKLTTQYASAAIYANGVNHWTCEGLQA